MLTDSERGTLARACPNCTPICIPLWSAAFAPAFAVLSHIHAAVDPQAETTPPISSTKPPRHHAVLQSPSQ